MRRRTVWTVLLVGFLAMSGGCFSRLAKEGLGAATGGKGAWNVLQEISSDDRAGSLGQYKRFELGTIGDDIYGHAPGELFSALPAAFARELAGKKIPNAAGGKTLLIRGKVIHYENASMTGHAFGPLEEVVARIEFVDKDSGQVLAVVNCVGRTKESVNVGVKTKAQGLVKAIVGWIDKRYPKDQRVKKD